MKKFIAVVLSALVMSTPVLAADAQANVQVNGQVIDAHAVIVDSRTLVPVRGVFEQLGYNVSYDADTKTATLERGTSVVKMTAGDTYFTVGDKQITPEVPQQIIDSRFMLPLRAVSEAIGADVSWNADTKTAVIEFSTGLKIADVQTFTSDAVNEITFD